MRLAELSLRYPPAFGGVEATLEQLVERLRRGGIEVTVLTSDLDRVHPFVRRPDLSATDVGDVRRFRAWRAAPFPLGLGVVAPGMFFAGVGERFDVLHAHAFGYFPTWAAATARRLRGTPLVVTPHADPGRGLAFSRVYHRSMARATLRVADRLVAQSDVERRFLLGLGLDPERIVVLPTGIALDDFAGTARPGSGEAVRFLYVGRLDLEQKGLDVLGRALTSLGRGTPVKMVFVGDDWGALASLRSRVERAGIPDRVEFVVGAPRTRVLEEYRAADAFVLPSRFESFPRALLEAMAAGLPIVATRVGGVPEMVAEGENALLVPPGDERGLADALRTLADDPGLRSRFGAASRRRAEAYDWDRLIPRYRALFEELAGTG